MEGIKHAERTAAAGLGWLLDAGDGAVVTLAAGETRLLAHRAVLSDRSPVFEAMFRHDTLEARSGSVAIPDVEGDVLRLLLEYMYTLQAPRLPEQAPRLLAAADKYGLPALKGACERQVAARLSVQTAAAAAVLAIRHCCDGLRGAAVGFIKAHVVEVMATEGWADAVRRQPEDIVRLGQLLFETSTPPLADSGARPPAAAPQSPPPENSGVSPPVAASQSPAPEDSGARPPAAAPQSPPPEDSGARPPAAAPQSPPPEDSGARPPAAAPQPPPLEDSRARPPVAAPPEDAAVSRLRSLPPEEKGRRLIKAAERGAVAEVEALLAAGAAVGARGGWLQETALHEAAGGGHTAVVRLLLAAGADHGARAVDGWTPLHWAAVNGHREAAAALLEGGADRAARDSEGRTALDWARLCNRRQVAALLQGR